MKTILVVGDSFAYGHSCSDRPPSLLKYPHLPNQTPPASEFSWVSLLAKDLPGCKVINKALPGNSQFGLFNSILSNPHVDVIVFAGTFDTRVPIPSPLDDTQLTNWVIPYHNPTEPVEYIQARKYYTQYMINDSILQVSSFAYLMASYGFAKMHGIDFLWSMPYTTNIHGSSDWLDKIKDSEFTHVWNLNLTKEYISEDAHHPNDAGHRFYYENVIKSQLLSKLTI